MPSSLAIIIPVLNEEAEVARILTGARALLEARLGEWEIIVVDNASTDRTCELAAPFVDGKQVRLLRNEVNRGKGYSIRRGMLEATGDLRLMCDADCVDSLSSVPRMERAAEEVDVVIGSRLRAGASVTRHQPIRRRIVGAGFIALSRVVMGRLPRDVYCGFKLWRAEAASEVFANVTVDGWAFDAEALALVRQLGYTSREVGIEWSNRPDSRLSIGSVLVPVTAELLKARRNLHRVAATPRPKSESDLVSRVETA
ncbi:MAG: glycosyltransferase [Acidimicrobiales bacterium]